MMIRLLQKTQFKTLLNRCYSSSVSDFPKLTKMCDKVIVKHLPGETRFTFSFHMKLVEVKIDKQFNLNRELEEETDKFLERLRNNLNKAKKNKSLFKGELSVNFIQHNSTVIRVEEYKTINDFLFLDNLRMEVIGSSSDCPRLMYSVTVNPPLVRELQLSSVMMAGLLLHPKRLELQFSRLEESKVEWEVTAEAPGQDWDTPTKRARLESGQELQWEGAGRGFCWIPSEQHIGRAVRCTVTPRDEARRAGEPAVVVAGGVVTAGPGITPYQRRHAWTRLPAPGLRVVSYNILADQYADSDYSRTVLFPQCPAYALDIEYRVKLLLAELAGYRADLVLLQECDQRVWQQDLLPVLGSKAGLAGEFAKKGGQVTEGLATLYNPSKLQLISFRSVFLATALTSSPLHSHLHQAVVAAGPGLVANLTARTTTLTLTALRAGPDRILVVGNTHLYWAPTADHIRLLQTEMCRLELEAERERVKAEHPGSRVSTILAGDFNSTPPFGVLELLTKGNIPASYPDWASQQGEEVTGLSLSHQPTFISAAGCPQYTNYTTGFKDCLDYIFIEKNSLEVEQVVPFPSEEELGLHTALPNIAFPSDHVAVVVDLKWK